MNLPETIRPGLLCRICSWLKPNRNFIARSRFLTVSALLSKQKAATTACEKQVEQTLELGLKRSPARLFILSAKLALEEAVAPLPHPQAEIQETLKATLFTELYCVCARLFQKPNCIYTGSDEEIKIAFFSKNDLDEKLLQFHLVQTCTPLLGMAAAQRLVLLQLDASTHADEILTFFEQG